MEIAWKPNPKQAIALARTEDEILYGGARGGGKTDCGMAWLLYDIDKSKYRSLVIRRNADDLRDWSDRARSFYMPVSGTCVGSPPEITFPLGSKIRTGHLKDDNAYSKYQGHEYQKIVIEELTQIPSEDNYEKLLGSLRSTVDGIKPQVFATTNPDGPGYKWVKKRWNIPDYPTNEPVITNLPDGRKRIFIPSRVQDNPILMEKDPGYIRYLESITDPDLREAWLNGSWTGISIKGAYYSELMSQVVKEGRIRPVIHEVGFPVHTVWDLGVADSMAIGFVQVINNEIRILDYIEETGKGLDYFIKILKEKEYIYGRHFAPHDIEVRELSSGRSRRDIAKGLGINFDVVPNESIDEGIDAVRRILNRCNFDSKKTDQLVVCLQNYKHEWDDKNGCYKDNPLHDWSSHGADMFRYLALSVSKMTNDNPRAKQYIPSGLSRNPNYRPRVVNN